MTKKSPIMTSRYLYIKLANNQDETLSSFAKLMGIKNFLPSHDRGNKGIDFSFYERGESWFFYTADEGDFEFCLDLTIYLSEDKFYSLIKSVSKEGFSICIPDDAVHSPYIFDLYKNGQVSKVLEDTTHDEVDEKFIIDEEYFETVEYNIFLRDKEKFEEHDK